jgi:hypothetical protein
MKNEIKKWILRCTVVAAGLFLFMNTALMASVEYYTFTGFTVLNPQTASSDTNLNHSGGNQVSQYVLLDFNYGILGDSPRISSILDPTANGTEALLIGMPLVYPNPVRLSVGSEVGYRLSRNADTDIRIFDMRGNIIFKNHYVAGSVGGVAGYNRLALNFVTLNGFDLSSGVYFFVISAESKVIGKGKFVVVP